MTDLKPCPFCGSAECEILPRTSSEGAVLYRVVCSGCGARSISLASDKQCAEHWNRRASPWQPIETAPRDGTEFLAYDPKYGWVGTVRFDLPNDDDPEIGNPNWEFRGTTVGATHWMPLPEPPEEKG